MSLFTFTIPLTGQTVEIEGPPSLTVAQARQIFEQQLNAGSFVGLNPGDVISSASQVAGGLKSAVSQLSQAVAGVAGSAQGAVTGLLDKAKQAASAIPGADLVASAQNVASTTLTNITNTVQNAIPTNVINVANLATQATSLMPMQGLSQVDVRAAMSQASKLVDQAANTVSNTLGVGKFGFDAQQLERAGVLKPGTFSTFLSSGTNSLTSVLNSPSVWTGLDGLTNMSKLLDSIPSQDKIQQTLMNQGLSAVKSLGIPTGKLTPESLAGTALNAAKSVTDMMSFAKGLPLPAGTKAAISTVQSAAAFAVKFAKQGANDAVRQEDPAAPATDTVDRATVDAAATRVTGNDKIPPVNYQLTDAMVAKVLADSKFYEDVRALNDQFKASIDKIVGLAKATKQEAAGSQDPALLAQAIDAYEVTLGEFGAVQGRVEGLLREGARFEKLYQKKPLGYFTLEQLLESIKGYIAAAERGMAARKERLAALTQF